MIAIVLLAYLNWRIFTPQIYNPFEPLVFLSKPVPPHDDDPEGTVRYAKSYKVRIYHYMGIFIYH